MTCTCEPVHLVQREHQEMLCIEKLLLIYVCAVSVIDINTPMKLIKYEEFEAT